MSLNLNNTNYAASVSVVAGRDEAGSVNLVSASAGRLDVSLPAITSDAGGRLRVGQLETLNQLTALNADDPLMFENAGTGTGTWTNTGYTMAVTAGQWRIRCGRHRTSYTPGRSHQVEITGYNLHNEANVVKRVGYFDSNIVSPFDTTYDGFWFEADGTDYRIRLSRAGTSILNVAKSSWNGSQAAKDHDYSKFTVFLFDFLWLGGAIMRCFVKTTSGFALVHQFDYAGTESSIFMISPNHRCRYEIRSTTGSASMTAVCAQVSTEGSINGVGKERSTSNTTAITCATAGTHYPLLSLRLNSTYLDKTIKQVGFSGFVNTTNDTGLLRLCLNPTLSAPLTYTTIANSAADFGVGNGTITATDLGTVLYSMFIATNVVFAPNILERDFLSQVGTALDGTSDQLVVVMTPISGNLDTRASIIYREF